MQTAFRLLSTILLSSCQLCGGQTVLPSSVLKLQYPGVVQEYVVPSGVTRIFVKMWGAGGAGGSSGIAAYHASWGGAGGYTYASINVTPGYYLYIAVGQGGWPAWNANPGYQLGGWPNGGGLPFRPLDAGGGGGRSQISMFASRQTDKNAAIRVSDNILIIAAGGGGGGISPTKVVNGSAGGGLVGNNCAENACIGASASTGYGFLQAEMGSDYSGGGGDGHYGAKKIPDNWGGSGGGSSFLNSAYATGNTFAGENGGISYNSDDPDNNYTYGKGGDRTQKMWYECNRPCAGQNGVVFICMEGQCSHYDCPEGVMRKGMICDKRCQGGTIRLSSDTCQDCLSGKFSTGVDLTSCMSCDAGTYSILKASTCTSCSAGNYMSQTGANLCSQCGAGVIKKGINDKEL
jgi:hypothetical protein